MTGKQKTAVAVVLIVLVLFCIFTGPDTDNEELTPEQEEAQRIGYQRWTVFVKVAGGAVAVGIVGFLIYLRIDEKRLQKLEEERNKKI